MFWLSLTYAFYLIFGHFLAELEPCFLAERVPYLVPELETCVLAELATCFLVELETCVVAEIGSYVLCCC